ncbi:MAG TPA: hypothetical protein VLA13_08675 [Massilibacterium sp.]|nr:hypothetical protein [Massilibacterium sp.]
MTRHYEAIGDIRGWCGHKHRSVITAQKCADKDQKYCESLGVYSDRAVYAVADELMSALTYEERDELEEFIWR